MLPAVCIAVWLTSEPSLSAPRTPIEAGFRDMYDLHFDGAHDAFRKWIGDHPEDPLGPVSDAAAYLFSELSRLHILQSEFFLDDDAFVNRPRPAADPKVKRAFDRDLQEAGELADRALKRDPNDQNAQFAKLMILGLRSDYAALIEKKYLSSLGDIKNSRSLAEKLIAENPDYADAYLAIGIENYLLSLKPLPVRWFLRLTGAETDRQRGIDNLKVTAERGHYLQPYARILLAVAALRAKNKVRAKDLLGGLAREFPDNPLYKHELARLG